VHDPQRLERGAIGNVNVHSRVCAILKVAHMLRGVLTWHIIPSISRSYVGAGPCASKPVLSTAPTNASTVQRGAPLSQTLELTPEKERSARVYTGHAAPLAAVVHTTGKERAYFSYVRAHASILTQRRTHYKWQLISSGDWLSARQDLR
jgi:hypothetical protein